MLNHPFLVNSLKRTSAAMITDNIFFCTVIPHWHPFSFPSETVEYYSSIFFVIRAVVRMSLIQHHYLLQAKRQALQYSIQKCQNQVISHKN